MRRTLVLVSLAVTSMVALAFLIPLALTVREIARDRALTTAERQASALGPVLVVTEDPAALERAVASTQAGAARRMAVHMPDNTVVPQWPRDGSRARLDQITERPGAAARTPPGSAAGTRCCSRCRWTPAAPPSWRCSSPTRTSRAACGTPGWS
jgi:hypothetical protein